MKTKIAVIAVIVSAALHASADPAFDAGADLRIREELMENIPGLPGGGWLLKTKRSGFINHVRFRARAWGELRGTTENWGEWRVYTRLADEFRWCPEPYRNTHTFPDELIFDNLFLEGRGVFDGFLDLKVGRQDLYGLYGLDHLFVDGTPGDGSRTTYGDMAGFTLHFTEKSKLDLFALYDFDDCEDFRWGTDRSKHTSLTGLGGGSDTTMDDYGYGAIWGSELAEWLPYQLFVMQKNTHEFKDAKGVEHPWTQRETAGGKLVPRINEEWSLQFEGMGQVGCNGDGATLSGWSGYSGVNWKSATESSVKPFGKFGYHFMSGDDDAATEDGGHGAWDPMWARGVNDSELFLYGTHYGAAWWSNMHYVKTEIGLDLGRRHRVAANCGPMFAAAQDGLGGGGGLFKGVLSQMRYDFPLWLADKSKGERFEVFGHLLAEFFNPGDYFETDKPSYFLRWQVDFKF
ncbi:MAG: hypothetical protein J6T01_01510 [Kiritimatiellae bacterium]|nr:hypothetical protein [Kiritimatiellia bacterium]